ncbi:nucleotidyltransferase family protein [Compostibacter hankyongensis]|uniref:Nucleotidyltransferase n=1 Tax=Compostibacter hankyongensis TaxID=1007089 RepID=A0ABP8G4W6_9BACT
MRDQVINKEIILNTLHRQRKELEKYGVQRIGLFGSFVRGDDTQESDIDLLVDFNKQQKNLRNLVYLGDFLEGLFDRKVDLVTPQGLSKYIGPHILKEVQYAAFHA